MSGSTLGKLVLRDFLRREPRAGDRLRGRRLPAGAGADAKPTSRANSTAASPAPRAMSRSGAKRTRSKSSPACSKAEPPARRSRLLIRNTDQRSKDYSKIKDTFRPGHADYTYWQKYGIRDYRGGGRQSARETAVRVAAGAIAKKWLHEKYGIVDPRLHVAARARSTVPFKSWDAVSGNPFFAPDAEHRAAARGIHGQAAQVRRFGAARKSRPSPPACRSGWGEPVYDKLDADIAYNMMNINAVKGVEIGAGFAAVGAEGHRAFRRDDAAGFSSPTTPAASSAASRPGRTSSSTSR